MELQRIRKEEESLNLHSEKYWKVRLLAKIMERLNPMFSYQNSAFSVTPDKEGTGRVVLWREFGIVSSYTLESSFYSYRMIN